MLAGKMKLNHFLLIVAVVGVAGITGLYFACRGDGDGDRKVAKNNPPRTPGATSDSGKARPVSGGATTNTKKPTPPVGDPSSAPDDGLRDVDRELVSWAGKDLGSDKIKDAKKGKAWKINLYQDAGESKMNRAKVDLDRDDKWDEKWTFDGANISRQVAPADDEKYTDEYDWDGSQWVKR